MNPNELADLALAVAREAAALVRERRTGEVSVAATKTSEVDVVTAVDRECEELIWRRIAEQRPDDGRVGEESAATAGTSGVRWIVDPIDGTVNYLYGLARYAVCIAVEVDGVVVAGVVIDVARGVEYVARPGVDGVPVATRDGQPIAVNEPTPMALTLVATGFSYDREVRTHQAAATAKLLPQVRDIRRQGSCALDLCSVAEGTVDAYVEEGVNLWDYAAAGLIARAAGAELALGRGAGGLDVLVCAPAASIDAFTALTKDCGFWDELAE